MNSFQIFETHLGRALTIVEGDDIRYLGFPKEESIAPLVRSYQASRERILYLDEIVDSLKTSKINHTLRPSGTPFQKKVWEVLKQIPPGQVLTYSDVAVKIEMPMCFQAIAQACKHNPIAILIPCHRVIGKKDLGGYRWGVNMKLKLLTDEGVIL